MQIHVLGHLEASVDDQPVALGGAKQRAVLAMLGLDANRTVTADRLTEGLWGEDPPSSAANMIQNYVWRLRRVLADDGGAEILTHGRGYELRIDPERVDARRLERLVAEAGRAAVAGKPADAAREALALFRGEPLADLAGEPFAADEIRRLEGLRETAAELAIDADLAAGRHHEVAAEIDALLASNPLREHLHAQRMLALYRCGRQADALEAYHHARRTLVEAIGIEPGPELRRVHEAILGQDPSLDVAPAGLELPPELDIAAAPPLTGRDGELRRLRERWQRAAGGSGALVTVVGAHGMGKTRMAAAVAADAHRERATVLYAAGTGRPEAALAAVARARDAGRSTLLVVDDADRAPADVRAALQALSPALRGVPALVIATGEEQDALARLQPQDSVTLEPLDAEAIRLIAGVYAPAGEATVPVEALLAASGGVARRVHEAASEWARREAARRVDTAAHRAEAVGAEARAVQAELTGDVAFLQSARDRAEQTIPHARVLCPYKGLASFDTGDADCFFGRERLVAELVARLAGARLLGVVGPSGSGKSSVVRAGLLPALAGGVLPGSDRWEQRVIRPGEHPMRELRRSDGVLFVDQFEELFTACRDEAERGEFVAELVRVAGDAAVVLAVRADFYGRLAAHPDLARLLGANTMLVGPMGREELRRAIELPAHRAGLRLEPGLADRLIADCEGEPGALPLLSTTLLGLWQQRDGRELRLAAYERSGGVRRAVAQLAETAYERLDAERRPVARRVLLRLAGEDEGGAPVRRRVPLEELDGEAREVLDALADSRLVTVGEGGAEVAHEALLREWPRLRGWLDEDREGRRVQRHLIDAARDWSQGGGDRGELYRGARLASALEWRAEHEPELNATEREFLEAGRLAVGRARRRLQLVLAGVLALLVVSTAAALAALDQRGDARAQARAAEAQRLGAQAGGEDELDRSLLMARQGVALDDAPATRDSLLAALRRSPAAIAVLRAGGDPVNAIALHPDDRTLAVGEADGTLTLLDVITRRRLGDLPETCGGSASTVSSLAFSPDGTRLVIAGFGGGTGFVDMFDGRTRRAVTGCMAIGGAVEGTLPRAVSFSSDSRLLAVEAEAGRTSRFLRWNVRKKREGRRLAGFGQPNPDASGLLGLLGSRVVTSDGGGTDIRDGGTLESVRHLAASGRAVLSPAGGLVALGGQDGSVRVLDLHTGALRTADGGHGAPVVALRFNAGGDRLVTAGRDERLIVWDPKRAAALESLEARGIGLIQDLAVARDGRTAYSGGRDGTVIAWDLTGERRWERPFGASRPLPASLTVTADGSRFAVVEAGRRSLDVFDGRTLRLTGRIRPTRDRIARAAIAPGGDTVALTTDAGGLELRDARSGRRLGAPQPAHVFGVGALAFSADGRWLATYGGDGFVRVWDGRLRPHPPAGSAHVSGVADLSLNGDGTRLAVTFAGESFRALEIRSVPSQRLIEALDVPPGALVRFSADGRTLIYGTRDGRVLLLDTRTWKPRTRPVTTGAAVRTVDLSPDGRLLATTSTDGTGRLWDVASGRAIGATLSGGSGDPLGAAFIREGSHLAVLHERGGVAWDVDPASWSRHACAVAGRPLTRTEWADILPQREYAPACTR